MSRKSMPRATQVSMLLALMGVVATTVHANPVLNASNTDDCARVATVTAVATKAMLNPLQAPSTGSVAPDTVAGSYAQGVGTSKGVVAETRAYGSFSVPYTTSRVQEGNNTATGMSAASRLSASYPYRAVGKLQFSAGWCSASLIRRSVIVTAAHCVQRFGGGSTLYSGFQFIPGHYGPSGATAAQIAPYGTWTWSALSRPTSWANGTDTGSGSARNNDLAVLVLRRDSSGRFIGDMVGWLSYGWNSYSFVTSSKTGNLNTAAVTTLGYPGLMDAGKIMQRTDGPAYTTTISGAKQIYQGSNLTGGSSGGPWIVNFASANAALSGGATQGTTPTMAVVGVTSWGASDPNAPKDNWASQFGQNTQFPNASYGTYGAGNIGALLNSLCSMAAPEGGTYATKGYCN